MRKMVALLCLGLFLLVGCPQEKSNVEIINTINGDLKTYYEMSDGTWQVGGKSYQHRLKISGRMPNASVDSTFVYLSNIEDITFEQAWKAAGFSSLLTDYFSVEEAVLVEMKTE